MPVLAIDFDGPLMMMFGIAVTAAVGCAAGFVLGVTIGRAAPETPLGTSLRLTREQLASAVAQLEKASAKLNASDRSEDAGTAIVLGRRVSELSASLGTLQHKAQRAKGGSA